MGWITGSAVYFIVWWLVLFMVLPWGVRRHEDAGEGHDAGAPAQSRIILKMAVTTGVAFLIWLILFFVDRYELITLRPN